jgi:hypothetical protein
VTRSSISSQLSVACFAVAAVALLRPACANERPDVPKKLAVSIGTSFRGEVDRLELDGSALLVRASRNGTAIRISPTQRQWREFRRAIDEIGVWQWRSKYEAPVPDATGWSVHIAYSDRLIETGGYASGPEQAARPGSCAPTTAIPFKRFLVAVQRLLGGRPFGYRVGPLEIFELSQLQLVATHPAANPREQWADIRDPSGKIHRVWREIPGKRGRPARPSAPLGADNELLLEVMPNSVSVLKICQDPLGGFFERIVVVKKAGAR